MRLKIDKKTIKNKSSKLDSVSIEVIKSDIEPDLLMIRTLLDLPMNKRTNFLRVAIKGTHGTAL